MNDFMINFTTMNKKVARREDESAALSSEIVTEHKILR